MCNPIVVHAAPDDASEVAALFDAYRVWYGADSDPDKARLFLTQRLTNNESTLFFAKRNDRPVGFVHLYPLFSSISMEPIWLLNDLFVVEDARGHGIGTLLLHTAAQYASELGAIRLELDAAHTNTQAMALYERLGWKRDDTFQQYVLNLP